MTRVCLFMCLVVRVAAADPFPGDKPCDDIDACEKACKASKKNTCVYGGLLAQRSGDTATRERAATFFDTGCKKNDADACFRAGELLPVGDAATKETIKKAAAYFDKACGRQHVRACFTRGQLAVDANDKKLALAQFKKAFAILDTRCTKKDAAACNWLGNEYQSGRIGLDPDPKKASAYHDKACMITTKLPCPPPPPPPPPPGRPMTKQAPPPAAPADHPQTPPPGMPPPPPPPRKPGTPAPQPKEGGA
jgi:hypothetical protein